MIFEFKDIKFFEKNNQIEGIFLNHYSLILKGLEKLGKYEVKNEKLYINMSEKKYKKFDDILDYSFGDLRNKFNGKKTIYIHKNSGIPLIGSVAFGIVDRGTNIIEIKPVTSCNLDCIYCSVNLKKRPVDFVVEADYMIDELNEILDFKKCDDIEIHIGCQGEPLRYSKLCYLINEIRKNKFVKKVSMDTNATMLSETIIDELIDSGLTRFNVSLNSLDEKLSKKISGGVYNLNHVIKMIDYISKKKVELIIAPVWIPEINSEEIEKIIVKFKDIAKIIGIQKYLTYKFGKILKEVSWEEFYSKLKIFEDKYKIKLILDEKDFSIVKTKVLDKPFKKDEIVEVNIKSESNVFGEKIGVAKDRIITIKTHKEGTIKIKITRTKHNIFYGVDLSN